MNLSDLEWLSEIFIDKEHHAVSLRQLSYLSVYVIERQFLHYQLKFLKVYTCCNNYTGFSCVTSLSIAVTLIFKSFFSVSLSLSSDNSTTFPLHSCVFQRRKTEHFYPEFSCMFSLSLALTRFNELSLVGLSETGVNDILTDWFTHTFLVFWYLSLVRGTLYRWVYQLLHLFNPNIFVVVYRDVCKVQRCFWPSMFLCIC